MTCSSLQGETFVGDQWLILCRIYCVIGGIKTQRGLFVAFGVHLSPLECNARL